MKKRKQLENRLDILIWMRLYLPEAPRTQGLALNMGYDLYCLARLVSKRIEAHEK